MELTKSDEALVAEIITTKDREAFETLVKRYQNRIFGLMLHLTKSEFVAEDLTQETFVQAWEKISSLRASGKFAAWLSKIAYTRFLRYYRRRKIELKYASVIQSEQVQSEPTSELSDLERYLSVCTDNERTVLLLYYLTGLNTREIGEILVMPTGTIKSLIHRAKIKIRSKFHHES